MAPSLDRAARTACATSVPKRIPRCTCSPEPSWGQRGLEERVDVRLLAGEQCVERGPRRGRRCGFRGRAPASAHIDDEWCTFAEDAVDRVIYRDFGDGQRPGGVNRSGLRTRRDEDLLELLVPQDDLGKALERVISDDSARANYYAA